MSLNINQLLKATGNEYATIVGKDGVMTDPAGDPYDTGSYTLNALLSGSIYDGLCANKITGIAGEQGVGKTFFVLSAAEAFLNKYPDGIFVYFDSESATTAEMLGKRVGHTDRIIVVPVVTVQEIATQLYNLIDKFDNLRKDNPESRMFLVIDSLGNLSTTKEVEDIEAGTGTKDMTRAQLLKGTFRALTVKLAKSQVPLVFTNHTYQGMGMFATKTMSGGGGPLFNASQIIFLSKAQIKEGTEKVGNIINMKNFKGRATREGATAKTRLFFKTGLDKYYGLLEIALKHDVLKKSGNMIVMPDGTKYFEKTIYGEPEKHFTPELLDLINTACAKEFLYGD
jgi:RecA/RadA recombinase